MLTHLLPFLRVVAKDHLSILQDRRGHIGVGGIGKLNDIHISGCQLMKARRKS